MVEQVLSARLKRRTKISLAAFVAMATIVAPAAAQNSAQQGRRANGGSSGLARILTADMLNVEISFLESITGPARRVHPMPSGQGRIAQREYRINGCDLTAITSGQQVSAYRLRLSPNCTFDVRRIVPNFRTPVAAHRLTFAMLSASFGITFLPSCLSGCGNAADPAFSVSGESSRADGFIEVLGTAIYNNEEVAAAADHLFASGRRLMSESDIIDGRFNCHPRYQDAALQAFQNVHLQEITIGYGITPAPSRC